MSKDLGGTRPSGAKRSVTLATAVHHSLLPTPLTSDMRGVGVHGQGGNDLRTEIALLKTPTAQLAVNGGSPHPDKRKAGGHGPTLADEVEHLLPTPTTQNAHGNHANGRGEALLPGVAEGLLPTPVAADGDRASGALLPTPAAHDSGNTPENHLRKKPGRKVVTSLQIIADYDLIKTGGRIDVAPVEVSSPWGPYAAAIDQWERVTRRPAPSPTNPDGKGGSHRLAPEFSEWMMGLNAGHVTDPGIWAGMKPGTARAAQLKAIGNGVVPQHAELATRSLIAAEWAEVGT